MWKKSLVATEVVCKTIGTIFANCENTPMGAKEAPYLDRWKVSKFKAKFSKT